MNNKFVKICLQNGIEDSFWGAENGLFYSTSSHETFINKEHITSFFVDEKEAEISIILGQNRAYLQFPDKGGEFQRIKRELNSLLEDENKQ